MSTETPCPVCGTAVPQPETGRPRQYCGPRCKKAAGRARKAQEPDVMVDLEIEAQAGETVEAMDDVIDLDAASTAELRVLATDYGVSPDGDRERLIQRILQASRAQAEGGPPPEPEVQPEIPRVRKWMHPPEPKNGVSIPGTASKTGRRTAELRRRALEHIRKAW